MSINVLISTLLLLVLPCLACDGTSSKQIQNCKIDYCVDAGWYDWEWQYDCTATDTTSGISSSAKHYDSSDGACKHATLQLFDIINDCNCQEISLAQGKTQIICFFFANEQDLDNGTPMYRSYVTDPNYNGGITVEYCCSYNATEATIEGQNALAYCESWQSQNTSTISSLGSGNIMNMGDSLIETNCKYFLLLQGDSNLIVFQYTYGIGEKALWTTQTDGQPPSYLALQTDGNLVLYKTDGSGYIWTTGTGGKGVPPYKLTMQGDGNLVWQDSTGAAIWNAGS